MMKGKMGDGHGHGCDLSTAVAREATHQRPPANSRRTPVEHRGEGEAI